MSEEITRYELDVLRWHKDQPRRASENRDCKDSQIWLALAGYLTRNDKQTFSITTKGLKLLATRK